jgi:hypothetical protein
MKLFRSARWLLLALLLPFIPTSQAHAGVFISVGFAPPVLPVYVQPPCPQPNLIWSPGYWAYGDDGYYWVPGAWVPAPYEGALWTPPYWGWQEGVYMFHPGYWGWHVGYYGGVNYGFGYMGIGFVGGAWHGHDFAYNTAVVHVNETIIHTTYVDRTIVERNTIVNDRHVAYAGGPGGINHQPTADERVAMHEQHVAPTQFQQQHMQAARTDHSSYFNANHGQPQNVAVARPLQAEHHEPPAAMAAGARGSGAPGGTAGAGARPDYRNAQPGRPAGQPAPQHTYQPQAQPRPESHPSYQPPARPAPEARPAPQSRQESRPAQEKAPKEKEKEPHR